MRAASPLLGATDVSLKIYTAVACPKCNFLIKYGLKELPHRLSSYRSVADKLQWIHPDWLESSRNANDFR